MFLFAVILVISRNIAALPGSLSLSVGVKRKSFQREKRIYPRYNTALRMKYETPAEEGISWIKDISRGGLRFILVSKTFEIGTSLRMQINLPNDPKLILAQGSIVWIKNDEAGLSFSEAYQEDLSKLIQYSTDRAQLQNSESHQRQ